jgi:hypothetical protein
MNIKEIADKIIKEADVTTANYQIADRIVDINSMYLRLVEKAVQIGSKLPISNGEANSETFTVVSGSNTFTRTMKNVPIVRVDFKHEDAEIYQAVDFDNSRLISVVNFGEMRFWANQKQVFIEEGYAGTLRVTYARGAVTLFTVADYNLGSAWPSPDWLDEVFHDLLWLKLAYRQAKMYKKDRAAGIKEELDELQTLFDNKFGRDSIHDSAFSTDEGERGNNR